MVAVMNLPGVTVTPMDENTRFGAFIDGADLNNLSDSDFANVQAALYRYKLLVIRGQKGLEPNSQFRLNQRFDPEATQHGDGGARGKEREGPALDGSTFKTDIPSASQVRIVGKGFVPKGHYGTLSDQTLKGGSHVGFHQTSLTQEELAKGDTRLWRWHFDAPLYPTGSNCARVTSLFCHTLPKGPDQKVRFDDGTGRVMYTRPGLTAFIDCTRLYEEMLPEAKTLVENSFVEYAPRPFIWSGHCRGRNDGFALLSEGRELPLDAIPDADLSKVQILPMLWPNAMTGERAFMVGALAARKLHLKTSPDGPTRVVDDLAEVRQILDDLQRPFLKPENIVFSPYEEGDLAIWLNRACRHTAIEYPISYGPRIMHQCHLLASDDVANPTPIPEVHL